MPCIEAFSRRLEARIQALKNPTVMGLDPLLEYLPEAFVASLEPDLSGKDQEGRTEELLYAFNCRLMDAVADIIPAVKPQLAYYERYGLAGLRALSRSLHYAKKKGFLVILDGKRNDIASTASCYAQAYLSGLEEADFGSVDALTVNGYLGSDGIRPFLDYCQEQGKAIYILVRTSNPSAGDLQDLQLQDGRRVYEAMADLVEAWSQDYRAGEDFGPAGAVVGATWPDQARALRERMPHSLILVPGYGAQGATAEDCAASFLPGGRGAIVNASRSLICAYKKYPEISEERFWEATRQEALKMRQALRQALGMGQ